MSKMQFNQADYPHRRYNPLTGQWVIISPHRLKRPWVEVEKPLQHPVSPGYDKQCALCPNNTRASGNINPDYQDIYVFQNDYSALLPETPAIATADDPLFISKPARGTCRVICFSPNHSKTFAELSLTNIRRIIDVWNSHIEELGQRYIWVQVFENKGEMMGCSQPHPHGQIWASDFLPNELTRKDELLRQYYVQHGSNLLLDYARAEQKNGVRTVVDTKYWLAVVPYWAVWPFETMLLPKSPVRRMNELTKEQRDDLAVALKKLTSRYDNLFQCSFPYSMGWHFAPFFTNKQTDIKHWQLHALFYPPLLRSATVRKFLVGYEMLAESQRDLTPEQAAQRLRDVSDIHFRSCSL